MVSELHALSVETPEATKLVEPKRSAVEVFKETSRQLRGSIQEELLQDSDHFAEHDKQLLKFHGTYQQEDRDARKTRKKDGIGKHHMFMVRCKIPGGQLTAAQYLAMDDLAGAYGNGTLRLTSRQSIQLHGVLKSHLHDTIAGINACLLTTLGACGDIVRNIMACPAPHHHDGIHNQLQETAQALAAHLAPRSRAYHEIWLDGKRVSNEPPADVEPLYGKVYLPRKFKIGLALPEDNCVDVYSQDLGLLAIVENGVITGYNVLVGGGMGMTHGNANTFPLLAQAVGYVPAKSVVLAVEAVVRLFRDHGNRADRKRARIKYLVHDWGVEKFREVLNEYLGGSLALPKPVKVEGYDLHLGRHPQGNGKWYYGLSIENGRIKDEGSLRLRSGLRAIIERFQPSVRLTPMQDILLCDLDSHAITEIERLLTQYGIQLPEEISTIQQHSMACPAIPTCGLAISESERALPGILDELEVELKRLGLEREKLSVRMTGCPNGCARPYQSDIGIVGRSGDKFSLFVGGHVFGHRLNFLLKDLVPRAEIVSTLTPILEHFKQERHSSESFGDYCHRLGLEKLQALISAAEIKRKYEAKPAISVGEKPAAPMEGQHMSASAVEQGAHPMLPLEPTPFAGTRMADARNTNGNSHRRSLTTFTACGDGAALVEPETQPLTLDLAAPIVTHGSIHTAISQKTSETFLSGHFGEEFPDYSVRYNSDGSVRETIVYFYGDDERATTASPGKALRREAVYQGQVEPVRLHAARKLRDTYFVGSTGHERRDLRVEYYPDGRVAQTIVFYYDADARAQDAPSGAAVRRQVAYTGLAESF